MLHTIGSLAASLSVGAIAWVFFVQAPLLSRRLGRDRFVPLQMALMKPLVAFTAAASGLMLVASASTRHLALAGAALGLDAVLFVVAPRALRAGGQSLKEALSDDEKRSAGRFLADGGGEASRAWHRVIGLSVLLLVAAQVAWLVW